MALGKQGQFYHRKIIGTDEWADAQAIITRYETKTYENLLYEYLLDAAEAYNSQAFRVPNWWENTFNIPVPTPHTYPTRPIPIEEEGPTFETTEAFGGYGYPTAKHYDLDERNVMPFGTLG